MEPKKKKKSRRNFLYHAALVVLPIIYAIFTPLRFRRSGKIPDGKFIICCNHITGHDPFYLAIFHRKRKVCFMAKEELFRNRFLGALIRSVGSFPVSRGNSDRSAIVRAEEVIENGDVLGIFIEGTRSKTGELLKPKAGAALIAYQTNTPILPMCITPRGGTAKILFHRIKVSSGELIQPQELGIVNGTSSELRNAARLVMDRITALREEDLAEFERGKK
ncbi:MAG: 1-acyl-sn-glycerol-3-phosphate acyltransferase [Clostridia bacterium]|nr:1-acyl-sn-glycerol-3-phosphate acyltransferase [Clostridia bacterium]